MDIWPTFEEELKKYQNCVLLISQCLIKYEEQCSDLIKSIASKKFDDSQGEFDKIFKIQQQISTAIFKYEIQVSEKIRNLVYHLERDDIYSRKFWYKKFQEGQTWPEE